MFFFKVKVVFFSVFLLLTSTLLFSQNNIGQYYDEAPLRTWNIWASYMARNSAMGDCIFALRTKGSLPGMHNPAALLKVERLTLSGSFSTNFTQLYSYSVVNTGEVIPDVEDTNIDDTFTHFDLDHFGILFSLKKATIAINIAEQENYGRPELDWAFSLSTGDRIDATYTGKLRTLNFSFSYPVLENRLQVGAGFSYLFGTLNKDFSVKMTSGSLVMDDIFRDEQELKGYVFHLGLLYNASERFRMGFALRTPYDKRTSSDVYREFSSFYRGNNIITISNSYSSEDSYHQPLLVGWGFSYQAKDNLLLAADFSFFNWESYEAERFSAPLTREFRNILKIGIGLEYITGDEEERGVPLRIGYIYDPQPPASPIWNYHYLTFGGGFNLKNLTIDFAAQLGMGRVDDISLYNQKIMVSFTMNL